jgi:hypothetical protein
MKDMVAKDGEKITLGDTTVTIYSTPHFHAWQHFAHLTETLT